MGERVEEPRAMDRCAELSVDGADQSRLLLHAGALTIDLKSSTSKLNILRRRATLPDGEGEWDIEFILKYVSKFREISYCVVFYYY